MRAAEMKKNKPGIPNKTDLPSSVRELYLLTNFLRNPLGSGPPPTKDTGSFYWRRKRSAGIEPCPNYSTTMTKDDHLGDPLAERFVEETLQGSQDTDYHISSKLAYDIGSTTGDTWMNFKALPESIASSRPVARVQAGNRTAPEQMDGTGNNNITIPLVENFDWGAPNGLAPSTLTNISSASARQNDYRSLSQMGGVKRYNLLKALQTPVMEGDGEEADSSGSEVVQKFMHKYLEEQSLDLKKLIRRENNRAAARRSNKKKKLEKEAQKRELETLKKMEVELRAKDVQLRQENLWLRALVYPNGHNG